MWVLLLCIALPFCLLIGALLAAYAYGVWRAVLTGQAMPDLFTGLDRLPWQYIGPALGALFTAYLARGRQVVREIEAGGGQGRPPFAESSPSSSEPILEPEPETWPRPFQE
jgi:hypothetical protein